MRPISKDISDEFIYNIMRISSEKTHNMYNCTRSFCLILCGLNENCVWFTDVEYSCQQPIRRLFSKRAKQIGNKMKLPEMSLISEKV